MKGSFGGDGGRFSFLDLMFFLISAKMISGNKAKRVRKKGFELEMISSMITISF